ncbi:hypothetical protein EYF80_014430 [Liparis tanakae]|uniref:Uncharacterized protein n=1 Tax=Liparis tanakae TaxID=230148 RepID=A0A4Z2IED4_9TELE|nr:hypothetical protein EYF80_014430 [Liparis tanakae]
MSPHIAEQLHLDAKRAAHGLQANHTEAANERANWPTRRPEEERRRPKRGPIKHEVRSSFLL